MICYKCKNAKTCWIYKSLCCMSDNFSIDNCDSFDEVSKKYKRIAENDELMHLIYDYFLGQVEGNFSEEEMVRVIKRELSNL